jgi:hypothetical protein
MSELLPLFQPECVFSYATMSLAADGLIVSPLNALQLKLNIYFIESIKKGSQVAALVSPYHNLAVADVFIHFSFQVIGFGTENSLNA